MLAADHGQEAIATAAHAAHGFIRAACGGIGCGQGVSVELGLFLSGEGFPIGIGLLPLGAVAVVLLPLLAFLRGALPVGLALGFRLRLALGAADKSLGR